MRIESSIKGWFAVVAVSVSAVSCDMLDIMQDNKLSVSNMWKTAEQVEGSTYGIYSELRSNFVQSQINVFYWASCAWANTCGGRRRSSTYGSAAR